MQFSGVHATVVVPFAHTSCENTVSLQSVFKCKTYCEWDKHCHSCFALTLNWFPLAQRTILFVVYGLMIREFGPAADANKN